MRRVRKSTGHRARERKTTDCNRCGTQRSLSTCSARSMLTKRPAPKCPVHVMRIPGASPSRQAKKGSLTAILVAPGNPPTGRPPGARSDWAVDRALRLGSVLVPRSERPRLPLAEAPAKPLGGGQPASHGAAANPRRSLQQGQASGGRQVGTGIVPTIDDYLCRTGELSGRTIVGNGADLARRLRLFVNVISVI
jgi:hypothetical protein